jgi:hypothetical protein
MNTEDTETDIKKPKRKKRKKKRKSRYKRKDPRIIRKGKVRCQLCEKWYFSITNTHLMKEHGITFEEYKAKFEKARTVSNTTLALRARDAISKDDK